jgi:two-component system OmpR family response regulator
METKREYSVYLVDDDKMFLTSLKNSLQQNFGTELAVSEFTTGEECIENVNGSPDIVIMDYYLNDEEHPDAMDGLKAMKEIKSLSKDVVVIMLSGQDKLQVALDSVKNGAYEYIAKSESAFVRIQNTVKNAIENIKASKESSTYMKWNVSLGVVIVLIVLFDIVWYYSIH